MCTIEKVCTIIHGSFSSDQKQLDSCPRNRDPQIEISQVTISTVKNTHILKVPSCVILTNNSFFLKKTNKNKTKLPLTSTPNQVGAWLTRIWVHGKSPSTNTHHYLPLCTCRIRDKYRLKENEVTSLFDWCRGYELRFYTLKTNLLTFHICLMWLLLIFPWRLFWISVCKQEE